MAEWEIKVTRGSYKSVKIKVQADCVSDAESEALKRASDYNFNNITEYYADYEINSIRKI